MQSMEVYLHKDRYTWIDRNIWNLTCRNTIHRQIGIEVLIDIQLHGQKYESILDIQVVRQINEWTDRYIDRWMDVQSDRQIYRQREGQTDRYTEIDMYKFIQIEKWQYMQVQKNSETCQTVALAPDK